MDWHVQHTDMLLLQSLENDLVQFQKRKSVKWEKIVEKVQSSIHPGSPSEDWIIPPDENLEREELDKDPEYVKLRNSIVGEVSLSKKIANFLDYNTHHRLDWLKFDDPLIGNDALEDGIHEVKELQDKCRHSWYFAQNIKQGFNSIFHPLLSLFNKHK